MKKSIVAMGLAALVSTGALAHKHNYGVSVYDNYSRLPFAGKQAASNNQKLVQSLFPGFHAVTDKLSGAPRDIYGKTLAVPGNSLTQKSQYLLNNQLRQFEIVASDWKQTNEVNAPHAGFTHYKQFINGREVVFSQISFRFTKDGLLQRAVIKSYGQPQTGVTPTLTQADVLNTTGMQADLNMVNVSNRTVGNDWVWFPIPTAYGYVLHPAWPFTVTGTDKDDEAMPVELTGYIDATDGTVLYRSNEVKEEVNVKVTGSVYKTNIITPATVEPLANLAITINSATGYTNDTGLYVNNALNPSQTANISLQGRWVTVRTATSSGTIPSFNQVIAANGTTYLYPNTAPSSDQHVNAYYHTDRMHEFMKKFYPSSTGFTTLDAALPAIVDIASTTGCNAFYNGTSINFYAENSSCNSFAKIGDIIYHEYGHGINGRFYRFIKGTGGMTNGGLNEGYADIWAMGVTKDPILGRNAFKAGGSIRTYGATPKVYPYDRNSEVHANGEIIAGAWWSYGVNVGSVDSMSALFAKTLFDIPDGPEGTEGEVYHEVLISALVNDDDDANLSNLTPHFKEIVAAFAKHGIFLMMDAKLTHTEIAHQPAGTAISIAANIVLAEPAYFKEMKLIYKSRKSSTWDTVTLNNAGAGVSGGIDFNGQIPGQDAGTIIDYFIQTYDAQGNAAYSFPTGYNPALSSNQITLPYQFATGLIKKSTTDFETPVTGWQIATSSSETATSGKWIQAVPVASYWRPSGVSPYIQQTGTDNTTGSGTCLVTGNAGSTSTSYASADVDGGKTYAITPIIDLSSLTNPVIEFYRWYGNDQGPRDSNPRTDAWQVQMRDSSSLIWRNVDYTFQSDYNWRRRIFFVKDVLTSGSGKVQLRFIAADDVNTSLTNNGDNVVEAAVDDFSIYDAFPASVSGVAKSTFSIHPNPADHVVNITFSAPAAGSILMYDLTGRQVAAISTNANTATYNINTANLATGTYMLVLQNGSTVEAHKVVVAH